MKRVFAILLACLLWVSFGTCFVSADQGSQPLEFDLLEDNPADFQEIQQLVPSLRSQLNSCYEPVNFDQLTCDDLGQAVKIYIDAEIFSMETNRKEDVIPAIERCDYVYQYCFTYQQVPYEVTFSVDQPVREEVLDILTEEQIQDLYAKEGHWIIGPYGVQEERRAYQEVVQQQVEQTGYAPADPHVYIIGGIPNMRQPPPFL